MVLEDSPTRPLACHHQVKSAEERSGIADGYIKGLRLHLITAAYEYLLVQSTLLLTRRF